MTETEALNLIIPEESLSPKVRNPIVSRDNPKHYGKLTVVGLSKNRNSSKKLQYICKCDCGNFCEVTRNSLVSNNTSSCGCNKNRNGKYSSRFIDLTGKTCGNLTVISLIDDNRRDNYWQCRCKCGNVIELKTADINRRTHNSCGCKKYSKYCIYKHVFPNGKIFIGSSINDPKQTWCNGNTYARSHLMNVIREFGGSKRFYTNIQHFVLDINGTWIEFSPSMNWDIANFFGKDECEMFKVKIIRKHNSDNPQFGYNMTSGERTGNKTNKYSREKQSAIKLGTYDNRMYIVYRHINLINKKRYIGISSTSLAERTRKGKGYQSNEHFSNSIKKYSWKNFKTVILFKNLSLHDAQKLEIEYISRFNTNDGNYGYNLTKGGESSPVSNAKGVIVTYVNGSKKSFFSAYSAASSLEGCTKDIVRNHIRTGKSWNGIFFEYIDKRVIPSSNGKPVCAILEDGTKVTDKSVLSLSDKLQIPKDIIYKRIKSNTSYKGITFYYL